MTNTETIGQISANITNYVSDNMILIFGVIMMVLVAKYIWENKDNEKVR